MALDSPRGRMADLTGIGLSFACLLHCLALPFLLLSAPAVGMWILLPEATHAAILLLAVPAALIAMRDGWRRHGRKEPALLAIAGLMLLVLGLAAHEMWIEGTSPEATERLLTSLGALALASAHLFNWRLRHRS